jgi:hypothetical protein
MFLKPPKAKLIDDLGPEVLDLMGRIVITSGQLEWLIFLTTKRLRGAELRTYREVWNESAPVSKWCKQLADDAKVLQPPLREALESIVKSAEELIPKRNELFHGTWMLQHDGTKTIARFGRKLRADPGTIQSFLDRLRRTRDQLRAFPWQEIDAKTKGRFTEPDKALRKKSKSAKAG